MVQGSDGAAPQTFGKDFLLGEAGSSQEPMPSLKGHGYSPFHTCGVGLHRGERTGVPGHRLYPQNSKILLSWSGSAFQAVFTSAVFYWHSIAFVLSIAIFSLVENDSVLRELRAPPAFVSSVNSLATFLLTFFLGQCFSEANARFENVCKTNGNVSRLSALAGGILTQEAARTLMRYINAIMHIYYLLLSGPMDAAKWSLLEHRGLLTAEEIKVLQLQGSPAVVIYSWAIKGLRSVPCTGNIGSVERVFVELVQPMEQQFGGARGLAAKQIAYTLYQIPSTYFHVVYFAVNVYLSCSVLEFGQAFADAKNLPCKDGLSDRTHCYAGAVMLVMTEMLLIVIFLALLLTAEGMSDIYGNKAFHYDLGVDLDNLWQESQNVLKSMSVECPSFPSPAPAVQWRGTASNSYPMAM